MHFNCFCLYFIIITLEMLDLLTLIPSYQLLPLYTIVYYLLLFYFYIEDLGKECKNSNYLIITF